MALHHGGGPFLSIVIAARSDVRDSACVHRARRCVQTWRQAAQRHRVDCELVLVEYGSGAGLEQLGNSAAPCVRLVAAPGECRSVARNAGIRHARGAFVLVTGLDVEPTGEFMAWLAAGTPRTGRMYLADMVTQGEVPKLFAREGVFSLTPEGLRQNAADDITPVGSGICFGRGWFPPERGSEPAVSRWIDHDAWIHCKRPEGGVLALEIEPGPASAGPRVLEAVNLEGEVLARWSIEGRTRVLLAMPACRQGSHTIGLASPPGGQSLPGDPRILHYRVWRCDWTVAPPARPPAPWLQSAMACRPTLGRLTLRRHLHRAVRLLAARGDDIVDSGGEMTAGEGCHELETFPGERFRWCARQSSIALRMEPGREKLALLVEPGPAVGFGAFRRSIRQRGGDLLGEAEVRGVTYAEFTPPPAGRMVLLDLKAQGGTAQPANDPRTLAFRVFAIGRGVAASPAVDLPDAVAGGWPAHAFTIAGVTAAASPAPVLQLPPPSSTRYLHLGGSDEFVLMAREHWWDVRGYPEIGAKSDALASVLCYAAHHAGAHEEVLPTPLRLARDAVSAAAAVAPPDADLIALIEQMRYLDAPVILNGNAWGMEPES